MFTFPPALRRTRIVLAGTVSLVALASAVSAAEITWGGGAGNWNVGANWVGGVAPLAGDDALVDGGAAGDSVVTVTAAATIGNLTISTGDAVSVANGQTFTINGPSVVNNGTLGLASSGGFSTLRFGSNVTLSGGGVLALSNFANNQITGTGAFTLTNAAGHTIRGSGNIGANTIGLDNEGLVEAAGSAGLTLQLNTGAGVTRRNAGILRATNGGTLNITQGALDNATGVIEAQAGGTVTISGATTRIEGGALTGGGAFALSGTATLTNLTNQSTVTISNGQIGDIEGAITNEGVIALNSTGGFTQLRLRGDSTLTGGGAVEMSNRTANQITGIGAFTLTNAAGHTIRGAGNIGANTIGLDNEGLIEAAGAEGLTLQLNASLGVTRRNAGTLRAANGGTLSISQSVIDNAAGVIEAQTGGTVAISGGTTRIEGGALTGGGAFALSGAATLTNLTNQSTVTISNGQIGDIEGAITNEGVIALDSTGGFTQLRLRGDSTLTGGGAVEMSDRTVNQITGTLAGVTLTNAAGHTIRGSGNIGANTIGLDNEGLIEAVGGAGLTLQLNAGVGVTRRNADTLRAADGGTLSIIQGVIDNAAGVIEAQAGGTVVISGSATQIDGGSLIGDGAFTLASNATLKDLTNQSTVTINNGLIGDILGAIDNAGVIALDSTGGFTQLRLRGDSTLTGGGAVEMSDRAVNLITGTGAFTLTNAAGHTIRGAGNIGSNVIGLDNEGLVEAVGGAGLTLQLNAGGTVTRRNAGVLRATDGATLNINQGVLDNAAGVIEAQAGGTVAVSGGATQIEGGTLIGDGAFALSSGATLKDVLNQSTVNIDNGQFGDVDGQITNDGAISVDSAGAFTQLRLRGDVTLNGSGVLELSDRTLNLVTGTTAATLTNALGHTIRGAGGLGSNVIGLANDGLIEADGAAALTIDPNGAEGPVVNTGVMRASGAGGMSLTSGEFDNQGLVEAITGSVVGYTTSATTLNNAAGVLTGGQWRAAGAGSRIDIRGGQVTSNAAEIILSGAGSQFRAFQGAGFVDLEASLLSNSGVLRVLDNRDFAATNGLTNSGVIELGGGTLGAPSLSNTATGEIFGFGAITPNVGNAGTVRATGGTLTASAGITAASGTVISEAGATAAIGAESSAAILDLQGGSLALGTHDFTVSGDYMNAAFGAGNAFNRRANVTGAGAIIGADAAIAAGGDVVAGVLDLGTVRGGTSVTKAFTVENTGSGAEIRGAIQTAAGGGAITDARLSGAGVTAQNFGPVVAGGDAGPFEVTFDASAGGALSGQTIGIAQNFDNVADLTIALQGFATQLAVGQAAPAGPVNLGNFRVGLDGPSQDFDVTNLTAGAGAERLGIASATASGAFAGANLLGAGLIAGGDTASDAARVAVSGGVAGANAGQLTLQYVTDGTLIAPGFTAQNANAQVIDVAATGFNLAQATVAPDPVVIANQRVGGTESAALTVTNSAAAGAFTEGLNAGVGATGGDATTNGGSIALLAGGASDGASIRVGVDASVAGARSGGVTLNLASDGAGTSGFGALALADQTVQVQGDVFALAEGQLNVTALNFGTVQVGQAVSQALSVSNIATGPAGFVEDLDATFGAASGVGAGQISGAGFIAGLLAGSTDASSMVVSVNTGAAGAINGAIAVNYVSAGAVAGVSNGLGALAVGSDSFAVSGLIESTGTVIDAASPLINTPQPISLGNVRVGDVSPAAAVSVTNVATGAEQAALNATITGAGMVTAAGGFDLLAPGATDAGSLSVGMLTATAGAVSGAATIAFVSDASNVGGCAPNCQMTLPSQQVEVTGGVFQIAQPDAPASVDVGNFRLGDSASAALAITNTDTAPAGFQEGLDAAVSGTGGLATATGGPITNLAAGATSSAITVGIDGAAATAGVNAGTVTLALASNGAGTSGLATLALSDAVVDVTGTGFRTADPMLNTTALTLAARVGDAAPGAGVSVTNVSPDAFTEALNATAGAAPAGFTVAGAIAGLAAGATDATSLVVALDTAAAGTFGGALDIGFVSSGAGTTGAADLDAGAGAVGLTGRVYQAAQAQLDTPTINFGIVHVGDAVGPQAVTVSNAAPSAALNDTLAATFAGLPASAFSGAGAVSGLGAGASSDALQVSLDTSAAGVFDISGDFVRFASQNSDLADLDLLPGSLGLFAQVNNFANPVFAGLTGDGTLSGSGALFTLDFGTVLLGDSLFASFGVLNDSLGPVDLLAGSFDLGAGGPFDLSGFGAFAGLDGGELFPGLGVGFDALATGTLMQTVTLNAVGSNASGFSQDFGPIALQLTATVRDGVAPVPLPAPAWMLLAAMLGLGGLGRKRSRAA